MSGWQPGTGPGAAASTVQGPAASGAANTGSPVKIAGVITSGLSAQPAGTIFEAPMNQLGAIYTTLTDGVGITSVIKVQISGDAISNNATNQLYVQSVNMGYNGTSWDRVRVPSVFKPQNAVAVNAETTIWTPAAGKKFRLIGVWLAASVAGNVLLRDNTAGPVIAVVPSGAGGSGVYVDLRNGILSAAVNNVLTATGPAASTLSGIVFGTEE